MTQPPGAAYPPPQPGQQPQAGGYPPPGQQSPAGAYPPPGPPAGAYPPPGQQSPPAVYPPPGQQSPPAVYPPPGQPYPGAYGSPAPYGSPVAQAAPGPYGSPHGFAPQPPASGGWQPERVDQVTGTGFGLVHLQVPPITSGPAIGSLIAGIAAILVSFAVLCFGLTGAEEGWGALVAGAFTLLSVLAGGGAVAAAVIARRRIAGSGETGRVRFTGRGLTIGGMVCGIAGAALALIGLVLGLVLQLA
ncbi:phage holin family protein [Actinoplanes utahensis]|uniref:phage holin family protein n=1 Tax=Actinoplanes utahensis TaxID=1869 RepID=UPI001A4554B0|nr:phage holin family protein [Actinoplanes utahensis]GIF27855.1 hypothetical protein Aut01nite_08410 [Actinoplanes utahensis]